MALTQQQKADLAREYGISEETIQQRYGGSAMPTPAPIEDSEQTPEKSMLEAVFEAFLPKTAAVVNKLRQGETPTTGLVGPPFIGPLSGGEAGQAGRELALTYLLPKVGKAGVFNPRKFVGRQIESAVERAGTVPEQIINALRERLGVRFSGLPDPTLYERLPAQQFPQAMNVIRGEASALQPITTNLNEPVKYLDLLRRRIATSKAGYKTTETGARVAGAMKPVYQNISGAISQTLKEGVPQLKILDPVYSTLSKISETGGKALGTIKRAIPWVVGGALGTSLVRGLKGQ